MKIALLGTRGIPASYSGFETCVEQLGKRLVDRDHEVSVYCRTNHINFPGTNYLGMRLIKFPAINNKYLDTISHSFISSIHAISQDYDICLYFIAGNSPVTWIPRLTGAKTILNVDGLDWKREKWPQIAKKYIQFSESLARVLPNEFLTDSKVVQAYYEEEYQIKPHYIPYGSEVEIKPPGEFLKKYQLDANQYLLFVGRLVPENNIHHLVQAFRDLDTQMKCVIVGDSSYADEYKTSLQHLAGDDQRIIFTGYVFGEGYYELGSNAYIFVETSGVGGTHPAVVEAMAFGNCVVVNNTPENLETIGNAGFSYDGEIGAQSLKDKLGALINDSEMVHEYQNKARERARMNYSWESVTDQYEELFQQLVA